MIKVLLVGAGKMGSALRDGWLKAGCVEVLAVDPASSNGKDVVAGVEDIPAGYAPDVVVLAVKPQVMAEVAPAYAVFNTALFISIAAGKSLDSLAGCLEHNKAIVRAMPNLPATIGMGITACIGNGRVQQAQRDNAHYLLQAVGVVCWLDDEAQMDAVTAVSGSGPAYFFHMVEAMISAAEAQGLPHELSEQLVLQTFFGSASLLQQSYCGAVELRERVTSPGGTTAAGLHVMMENGLLTGLMKRVVECATQRSRQLNN